MTKDVLTCVISQEVKLLVSHPKLASGNSLQENIHDFESLDEMIQLKGLRTCVAQTWSISWEEIQTRLDEDDGFGQF